MSRSVTCVEHLKPFICICDCDMCVFLARKDIFPPILLFGCSALEKYSFCLVKWFPVNGFSSSLSVNECWSKWPRRKCKCLCALKWHWRWRRSEVMAVVRLFFWRNMCFITTKSTIQTINNQKLCGRTSSMEDKRQHPHSQDHKIVVDVYDVPSTISQLFTLTNKTAITTTLHSDEQ